MLYMCIVYIIYTLYTVRIGERPKRLFFFLDIEHLKT